MNKLRRRYPGVTPFETFQADQYFGRQRDVQDLSDLIILEKLVVLFGKSGYGKSSLLNAGIIPKLTDQAEPPNRRFSPLVIKFTTYTVEAKTSPVQTVRNKIDIFHNRKPEKSPGKNTDGKNQDTLWFHFKRWQKEANGSKYVLIFDQFEEFFTYPKEQQAEFREQLAELLYTQIPQDIRENWDDLSEEDRIFYSEEINIRAVFAIREDRLSWLNSLKGDLPAILHKRYELKGLTEEQAKEAIRKPAALAQNTENPTKKPIQIFESHSFTYSRAAEDILLKELKKGGDSGGGRQQEGRIEAFLLQICCENIESRLIERAKKGDVDIIVDPEDLPRFDRIYEEYYNGKINELPEHQRDVAKRLIEDELISYNGTTGVVFRLSADGRKLCMAPGITDELLKKLTDSFLLRAEPNTTGGFNFEISHDTLVAPVLKAKDLRQAEEKRLQEERLKAEKELELANERRKRQRTTLFAIIVGVFAIVAFIASLLAFNAQQMAEKSAREAIEAKKIAEQRLFEIQRKEAMEIVGRGDQFLSSSQDEPEYALAEYEKALTILPNDTLIQNRIARCKAILYNRLKKSQ